ncbi:hypothetical protein [Micromonospora carbonacea]|uniref:hypothetical protein n=1 Tax=Micromonospora carbonacea TaxID=47853 RepID=UPI0033E55BCA
MFRLVAAHTVGASVFIGVWQAAIALPAGPTDVRLVLAGLTIPTLAATGSALTIATAQYRREYGEQAASVPAPRPAPAARKELTAR